jgi:oligopeptide transport system substrate-binding protein
VKWYPTENQATGLKRYLAGEIDIMLNFPNDQVPALKKTIPEEIRIWPGLMLNYLVLNNKRPPFDDARVRKALSISIDREGIVGKIVTPGSLPAYAMTPGAVTGYQPPMPDYAKMSRERRLAEARRLMQEAGFGPARPLGFDLKYSTLEENRRLAVALAAMWQAIGVKATPMNLELSAVNKAARTGDFAMLSYTWFAPNDDAYTFLGLAETGNPNNYSGYSNAAYDRMLREANATMDPARRSAMLSQAEATMLADHPAIPLFFYVRRFLVKPYVQGFEPNPRGLNLSRWLAVSK